jgi:peptidoglycan/xylan/chitin deacetylase (PgdA/CDA1 family)/SAM-dependent methyltransferase
VTAEPLVSVIVPARNAEATLAESLDSVLTQDVTDWEAIIVDDGSTDRTAAIAAAYAARDARFRTLSSSAGSAAATRNLGIQAARGRWLMFLDADDWVDASFMRKMLAALEAAPDAVAAYCAYCRVMPDGSVTPPRYSKEIAVQPFETFARRCAVAIHALLIDRRTIVENDGFDVSLRTCEDWDLWQRVAREGKRWVEVDEPLSFYRASLTSLTRNSTQMLADARVVIARGFSGDQRVRNPASAHAKGAASANGHTAAEALAWFALWNAASACGAGDWSVDPELLRALPAGYMWAREIALVLLDGLMVGSRCSPQGLAARWASFGGPLQRLIAALGKVWNDPTAARRVQYHLEQLLLDYDDLSEPRQLGLTLGIRVDARNPSPTDLREGIDQVYAYLMLDGKIEALVQFGALGKITKRYWTQLILEAVPTAELGKTRPGPPWNNLGMWQRVLQPGAHSERLARMAAKARSQASVGRAQTRQSASQHCTPAEEARDGDRKSFWDRYFATEDPWNYHSAYEQEKYQRQLALLPARPIGRALELACGEGHFTILLAPQVHRLTAMDISAVAVERARNRCRDQDNIEFGVLDLSANDLPGPMDLIVCSEVLYYLSDLAELRRTGERLVGALAPGGRLITAHAFILRDDMQRTAFDWDNPFGAKVIAETLGNTEGLALERSLQSELYRVDCFRRLAPGEPAGEPVTEHVSIDAPLETEVARHIVRGGARARRSDVARNERRDRVPVLMYHSVADDGPAALQRYRLTPDAFARQLAWLRANGFHAIMSEQLEWFIVNRHPFVGRPVLISFDDGFQDFADHAWPLLRAHDFTAEVFLVTDLVGKSALWDVDIGPPTPLMDAETVGRLASEGAFFGSHTATHRAIDGLSTDELAAELLRSRAAIAQWTGQAPSSFAAPFSVTDRRLAILAKECGYRVAFGAKTGQADLDCKAIDLPRIEVRGDRPFEEFVSMMEAVLQ